MKLFGHGQAKAVNIGFTWGISFIRTQDDEEGIGDDDNDSSQLIIASICSSHWKVGEVNLKKREP